MHTCSGVFQLEVFVLELHAVDTLAARAIVVGEVTALAHEAGNDAMEWTALETESLLAGAQSTEVLRSLGDNIRSQLQQQSNVMVTAHDTT